MEIDTRDALAADKNQPIMPNPPHPSRPVPSSPSAPRAAYPESSAAGKVSVSYVRTAIKKKGSLAVASVIIASLIIIAVYAGTKRLYGTADGWRRRMLLVGE